MSVTRGICPVCGRSIRLKVNGAVFRHGGEPSPFWPYYRPQCDGTNQLPKPEDGNDDD